MKTRKIVLTGGPSTGKTTVIDHLSKSGETCFEEISREIILNAQKQGIDQLFLTDPDLFSSKLLEGRINQFLSAEQIMDQKRVFLDRGIPDILAYMRYVNANPKPNFVDACREYVYDTVFILPPWKEIHTTDNERYESFEEASQIYNHLKTTYQKFGYDCPEVPFGTIEERVAFILEQIS